MTGLLASVRSLDEALIALRAGADIIDLKEPSHGALGALPSDVIREVVERIAGRRPVSATAGDLPMEPAIVGDAVARIADLGVDFVKVGLFPGGDPAACLEALSREAAAGTRIVVVLFADQDPDFTILTEIKARGLTGAMLDTANKGRGGLRDHLSEAALGDFLARARALDLVTGLAGSLGSSDVPSLLRLGPDYLGFRGALTRSGRVSSLDPAAIATIRAAIPRGPITSPPVPAARPQPRAHSARPIP